MRVTIHKYESSPSIIILCSKKFCVRKKTNWPLTHFNFKPFLLEPLSIILLSPVKQLSCLNQERNVRRSDTVYKCYTLIVSHSFLLHNWWTVELWIIVIFLSADWTLILTAPIHCSGSIGEQVMQCQISLNMCQWRNKLIYILAIVRVNTFSANFISWRCLL